MIWLMPVVVGIAVIGGAAAGMVAIGRDRFGAGEWACAACTAVLFVAWIVISVRNRRWQDPRRRGFPVIGGRESRHEARRFDGRADH